MARLLTHPTPARKSRRSAGKVAAPRRTLVSRFTVAGSVAKTKLADFFSILLTGLFSFSLLDGLHVRLFRLQLAIEQGVEKLLEQDKNVRPGSGHLKLTLVPGQLG